MVLQAVRGDKQVGLVLDSCSRLALTPHLTHRYRHVLLLLLVLLARVLLRQ